MNLFIFAAKGKNYGSGHRVRMEHLSTWLGSTILLASNVKRNQLPKVSFFCIENKEEAIAILRAKPQRKKKTF